jgi:hypothetical protein
MLEIRISSRAVAFVGGFCGLALTFLMSGCFLDRSGAATESVCADDRDCPAGQACLARICRGPVPRDAGADASRVDAGADASPLDSGPEDSATPLDSGPDAFSPDSGPDPCANRARDGDETDVDCGGSCAPCAGCRRCTGDADCVGTCRPEGVCEPSLSMPTIPGIGPRAAFVREDGAVLLAHYTSAGYHAAYQPSVTQGTSATGGRTPPSGWAPDPCVETGHLEFGNATPGSRRVTMECGADYGAPARAVGSTFFSDFSDGPHGPDGAMGDPGWGIVASRGSGQGRSSYAMCGTSLSATNVGIAYCNGSGLTPPGTSHIASYSISYAGGGSTGSAVVGCNARFCGATEECHVWIWLE